MAADDPMDQALGNLPPDSGGAAPSGDDMMGQALGNLPTTSGDLVAPPPPTRKLGPPRVHAAAHQPRPAPRPAPGGTTGAQGPAPPAAPPPAPSWGQVLPLAAQNLLPSLGDVASDTLEAAKPSNWKKDVQGLTSLAKGTAARMGLQVGASTQDQQIADAFIAAKQAQWGFGPEGSAGLRRSLAYHPAENLMDVATVAAPLEGGLEAAGARLPGIAGDVATTGARIAGGVEAATNPIGYPFRAMGLAKGAIRGASGARSASSLAADAEDAANTLRRVNPNERISREMVSGQAAPTEAAAEVAQNRNAWRGHAGDAATDLVGAEAPHDSELGDQHAQAYMDTQNTSVDNYDKVGQHTGEFDPATFGPSLQNTIEATLRYHSLPPTTGPGSLANLGSYDQTVQALTHLNDRISDLAANNALTPKNLMALRQSLGRFYKGAEGSDFKGVRTVQEALDNQIQAEAAGGNFSGPNGPQVAADMQHAIAFKRDQFRNFDEGPAAKAVQILKNNQISDPTGRITGFQPGTSEAVTSQLGKSLINPNLTIPGDAPLIHQNLTKVMGGPGSAGEKALNDYVRQSVGRVNSEGYLAAKPEQIKSFLNRNTAMSRSAFPDTTHPVTGVNPKQRMMDAAETERLAKASTAKGTRSNATISSLVKKGITHGTSVWLGSHFGPMGTFAGEAFASHVLDPWFASRAVRGEFKPIRGARAFRRPGTLGPIAKGITRAPLATRTGWGATYQSPEEQQQEAEKNDQDIVTAAPPVGDVAKASVMGKAPAASPTDIDTVVRMAAAEGDPTPEGWKAVAAVMRNRSLESGNSLSDIAAEPRQFEAYGNRNYAALQPGTKRYNEILAAIAPVMAGKEDPTDGADGYYAPALQARLGRHKPSWDDGTGKMIGTQLFFKNQYRRPHAAGGQVLDLTDRLLRRADLEARSSREATKPLLALPDATVHRALAIANRAI